MALTRPPLSFLNTNSTVFSDPLLVLHQGSSSSDSDVGFVFNRANGLVANVALYWSEADKAFYTTFTNSGGATDANLVPTTYANLVTNVLSANTVSVSGDATVTGNLTVNGATTTVSTTNTLVSDSLMELNTGAGSNANDLGFIFERGSTGDNAAIIWDESADAFVLGTTTATGASTGDLTVTAGALSISSLTLEKNNPNIRFNDSDTSNNGEITLDNTALRIEIDEDDAVASSIITFRVDASEKMRIDSSGNVGIGTSSPSTVLEISSGDSGNDAALGSPTLRITNSTESTDWDIGDVVGTIEYYTADVSGNAPYVASFIKSVNEQNNGTLPSGALTFGTATYNAVGGAVERVRIDDDGNVGIGNTAPASPLTVAGVIESTSGGVKFPDGTTQTTAVTGSPATIDDVIAYAIALG